MKKLILPLFALALLFQLAPAQHLRRKTGFGLAGTPLSDSLRLASKAPSGILVQWLLDGGTAQTLGVQHSDIILKVNGNAVGQMADLQQQVKGRFDGDPLQLEILRKKGKKYTAIQLKGSFKGLTQEQSDEHKTVHYGEVAFKDGALRSIMVSPKSAGPHPIVYFIPGYNCFSIDNLPAFHPYHKFIDSLVALGNSVFRVEKAGMGDGPNPCNCETGGFEEELAAFTAGYAALKAQNQGREDNIFLFGHSMGGVQAPLLVAQQGFQPGGIAVYGTVFQTWYEYILAMLRFQEPRSGEDYLAFEDDMKAYIQLFYAHYVEFKPLEAIVQNAKWKALLERDFLLDGEGNLLFRRAEYWQELAKHSYADAWAKVPCPVLSMYGEADFEVFNAFSMAEIARIVNTYHPGNGQFVEISGTDHGMIKVGPMEEALKVRNSPAYRDLLRTRFNYEIVEILDKWVDARQM